MFYQNSPFFAIIIYPYVSIYKKINTEVIFYRFYKSVWRLILMVASDAPKVNKTAWQRRKIIKNDWNGDDLT